MAVILRALATSNEGDAYGLSVIFGFTTGTNSKEI